MADELTDAEAAVLRVVNLDYSQRREAESRIVIRGWDSENADAGRAALAAYDAQKRREILRPALELLETIEAAVDRHTTSGGTAQSRPVIVAQATIDAIRDLLAKEAP